MSTLPGQPQREKHALTLREQESVTPTADAYHKHGISSATFYSAAAGLISLMQKLLTEAMLDNAMLKDVASKMVTPAARREAVPRLRGALEASKRRACAALGSTAVSAPSWGGV
jgi:putative transposase